MAGVGIPLALALLVLGGWFLGSVLAVAAALCTRELFRLAKIQGVDPFLWLGFCASPLLVLAAVWAPSLSAVAPWAMGICFGVFLLSSSLAVFRRWPGGRPMAATAATTAGVLYGGGCLSFGVLLRHLPDAGPGPWEATPWAGTILLAFPFAITWVGDSAAFFAGRRIGGRKLLPAVSPGKTVAGSIAGGVASVLVGAGMGWWLLAIHPRPLLSALLGAGIGLVLGAGAQVGDLAESVLKREAGVKDSGDLLPGHGGVLDRFDALLFNLPLGYALFRLVEWVP